ncbi:MAG: hypothetical protein ISR55_04235 [Bacteroidetes bacterium]|nr:hypothetical protein [Bacteroidota bacterium]
MMRPIRLYFAWIALILFASCGSNNSTDTVITDVDTINQMDEIEEAVTPHLEPDFNHFWEVFAENSGDMDYVMSKINFPYAYASYTNSIVSRDDFLNPEVDRSLFQFLSQQSNLKIGAFEGANINGYLHENFTSSFGNLENMYVVESSPEPIGYLAYFRFNGEEFQFIGCELLEIAD